jgi:NAD(P)-dependent dehydrogenase (short-subunit alcohol dehydrogenase family)
MTSSDRPLGTVHYDNAGRVAPVTGGCGGIGLAICQAFRRSHATVVAVDIDDSRPFVTATDLAVDGGLSAFGAFADPYLPRKGTD